MFFAYFFLVLFSLWDKYLFEAEKYFPTAFSCKRYLMIKSRYNLIFNVKRTAVYFMVEDFYCWIFFISNTFIQLLIESYEQLKLLCVSLSPSTQRQNSI